MRASFAEVVTMKKTIAKLTFLAAIVYVFVAPLVECAQAGGVAN